MGIKNYNELLVWQKSIDLVEEIYKLLKYLPSEENYALSNQMRRAVISIPSNIAEGQQRKSTKEFINFLSFARGSKAELQTQCYICVRLNYLDKEQIKPAMNMMAEIGKMLNSLIDKLNTSH